MRVKTDSLGIRHGEKSHTAAAPAVLAFGLFFAPPISSAIDAILN
jgi:hypothetical protein